MVIIDGHNAVFSLFNPANNDILNYVKSLTDEVKEVYNQRQKKAILVFDGTGGAGEYGYEKTLGEYVRLVYSGKISADEWIANWIAYHKGETVVLVTSDKRMFEAVRRKGITRKSVFDWYEALK